MIKRALSLVLIISLLGCVSADSSIGRDHTAPFAIDRDCVSWSRGCIAPTYGLLSNPSKYHGVSIQYDGFVSWSGHGLSIYPTVESACFAYNGIGIVIDMPMMIDESITNYIGVHGVARVLVIGDFEANSEGRLGSALGALRVKRSSDAALSSSPTSRPLIDPSNVQGSLINNFHYMELASPSCMGFRGDGDSK